MNTWETTITASATAAPADTGAGDKLQPEAAAEDLSAPYTLPLRTRVALWVLLGCAVGAMALLWDRTSRGASESSVATVAAPAPKSADAKKEPAILVPAVAPKNAGAQPEKPAPPALAEVEVLATLSREDPTFNVRTAIARLKPYTESKDDVVREAASKALAPLMSGLESKARSVARYAAEDALDQADEGNFSAGLAAVTEATKKMTADVPWTEHGRAQLQHIVETLMVRRAEAISSAQKDIESALSGSDEAAAARVEQWLKHPDPDVRSAAQTQKIRIEDEQKIARAKRLQRESMERQAWLDFFTKFGEKVADGELDAAEDYLKNSTVAATAPGGVSEPQKVLAGCLEDVALIRKLQAMAIQIARSSKRNVALTLRRGRVDGNLDGADGRQIFLSLNGGARVGVKVENLSWASLLSLLEPSGLQNTNLASAASILNAYEKPAQAPLFLPGTFARAKLTLPLHWSERMRLEKFGQRDQELDAKLNTLDEALKGGNAEVIKAALDAARPAIAAFEKFGQLSDERQKALASAEKIVGKAARARIVLQNGLTPAADYSGISTDQISQYRDSAKKTDVGVQFGVKVGSSGGVHRMLVRVDGIEAAIGKGRVRKATLEFYQIESPQSADVHLSLFRLKKPWVPDAGTWISFDANGKNTDWTIAGASGDADIESKDDAKTVTDTRKNVWRSFDLTAYVQDVLAGKLQNLGFLMRVTNGEPEHQVRFYPETDIEGAKDKSLRPRLVLEVESE